MSQEWLETWNLSKPAVHSREGIVVSQHYLASGVGARVLGEGGNAVDAAVAAGLAIGTVEPWMSGLGGGGQMLVWPAGEEGVHAVDFGLVAPADVDLDTYALVEGTGADLFDWPRVVEDRNLRGPHSMAVPGFVAGCALALERYGTRGWGETLGPAIDLVRAGLSVDWYASLKIATAARQLAEYEESRRVYLPGGFPPVGEWGGPIPRIALGNLGETLERLAFAGARDFYEGATAGAVVEDAAALGSRLQPSDLAAYTARIRESEPFTYRDATIHTAPGLTAGPTLVRALGWLSERLAPSAAPDAAAYAAYASCLLDAYEERLSTLGEAADDPESPSCTTHLCVVDKAGTVVALTQTLLSLFGSKTVLPRTGILMNNGMMWFDPRPGGPNSIAPGRRPLSNMCPVIIELGDGSRVALGASGGRRILPAVFQLISFLVDYGMDTEAAFHQPRIDASGTGAVIVDNRLPAAVHTALAREFTVSSAQHGVYPALFACPNAAGRSPNGGGQVGSAFVTSPWAKACAADDLRAS